MDNSLKKYQEKRNFNLTNEPEAKQTAKNKEVLEFVVQLHYATTKHYDFRLEYNGVLLSWAVPKGPSFNPVDKRLAVQVEDHPYDYKNFEGIIPSGQYGAGSVIIFDNGYYVPYKSMKESLKEGKIKFLLQGKRLNGMWMLLKKDEKNWFLMKLKDQYSKKTNGISRLKTSIISGLTNKELEDQNE